MVSSATLAIFFSTTFYYLFICSTLVSGNVEVQTGGTEICKLNYFPQIISHFSHTALMPNTLTPPSPSSRFTLTVVSTPLIAFVPCTYQLVLQG